MLLVMLSLLVADVPAPTVPAGTADEGVVVVTQREPAPSAPAAPTGPVRDRHGTPPEPPPPMWMFFVVPAGLSLTTSLLLAGPEALTLLFATSTTVLVALAGAPIVAAFGIDRLEPRRSLGPIVGSVVGDVAGVLVGSAVGAYAWLRFGSDTFAPDDAIGPVNLSQASLIGSAVAGAWVVRAVGCGTGSVAGRVVSLALEPEPISP